MIPLVSSNQKNTLAGSPVFFEATPVESSETKKKTLTFASRLFASLNICRMIKDALHVKIGEFIVPAQSRNKNDPVLIEGRQILLSKFCGEEITLKTPDGIVLDGMFIRCRKDDADVSRNSPTIIHFNGNGERFECSSLYLNVDAEQEIENRKLKYSFSEPVSNLRNYLNLGFNVFLFNYRGVARSQGRATSEGLVLDGETAFQFVHQHLGVPKEHILLFGHSLGGAIAAHVAVKYPGTHLCSDRSFSSLDKVVYFLFYPSFFSWIASQFIKSLGWNLNSADLWEKIKGKKWIVYHPADKLIPFQASLLYSLQQRKLDSIKAIQLKGPEEIYSYFQQKEARANQRPLTKEEMDLVKVIIDDSGFTDAHNRKLLPREIQEVFEHFKLSLHPKS